MLRYLHARECQMRNVNRRTSAVHLPEMLASGLSRAALPGNCYTQPEGVAQTASNAVLAVRSATSVTHAAVDATSLLRAPPIVLTPATLAAHPALRASVLLDLSVCGDFLLAYACVDGDDGGAQVYVLRAFSARSLALCYEFPLFRTHSHDRGGEQFGAGAAPLAVEIVHSHAGLLILHACVHDSQVRSPSDGRDHHLTLIPFRGALARCIAHCVDTACSECTRCAVCRGHKVGRARHFAFRSYAPHFRLTGGTHTILPLSEYEHRLVFNCGDAVHVATVAVHPNGRTSNAPPTPSPSSVGGAFQPTTWLTDSEVRIATTHTGSHCAHQHGRTVLCEFEVCVFEQRSCDVEQLLQWFLSDGGDGDGDSDDRDCSRDVKRARSSSPSDSDTAAVTFTMQRQLRSLNLRVEDFTLYSVSTPDADSALFLLGVVATPRCHDTDDADDADDERGDAGAAFGFALQRTIAAAVEPLHPLHRRDTLGVHVHAGAPPLVVLHSGTAPVSQSPSAWPALLRRAPTVSALRAASTPACVVLLPLSVRLRMTTPSFSLSPRASVALSSAAHTYIGAAVDAFFARHHVTALARTREFAVACMRAFATRALRPLHAALEARVTDTHALDEMRCADNFNIFTGVSKPSLQHATLPVRVVAAALSTATA